MKMSRHIMNCLRKWRNTRMQRNQDNFIIFDGICDRAYDNG